MGRLLVLLCAAILVCEHVTGGVASEFTQAKEGDFFTPLIDASIQVCNNLEDTSASRTWKNNKDYRALLQQIEGVIELLEEQNKLKHVSYRADRMVDGLREFHTLLQELSSVTDDAEETRLRFALSNTIARIVVRMPLYNNKNDVSIKTVLKKYVLVLNRLDGILNDHQAQNDLKIPMSEIKVQTEYVFVLLVREYLDSLREFSTPELHQYYELFYGRRIDSWTQDEITKKLEEFKQAFQRNIDRMPAVARAAFSKATEMYQSRFDIMVKIPTAVRYTAFRMHVVADYLAYGLEIFPAHSTQVSEKIAEHAHEFYSQMEHFVSRLNHHDVTNWNKIMTTFKNNDCNKHSYILAVQEATAEVHKWIVSYPGDKKFAVETAAEFIDILSLQKKAFDELGKDVLDADYWALHVRAKFSRMSMYLNGEVAAEDMNIVTSMLKTIIEMLDASETPQLRETALRLKKLRAQSKIENYSINTFLQKAQIELSKLIWNTYRRNRSITIEIISVLEVYLHVLEDIFGTQRINKGLLILETPSEIIMETDNIADRLNGLLHDMVPGFKHVELFYRGHHFYQAINILMSGLKQIEKAPSVVDEVYQNLNRVRESLRSDLKEHDLYFNVKLAMYIQEVVNNFKKLAFEKSFVKDAQATVLYGDLFFGLKHLLNQVQYNYHLILSEYTIKTFNSQINAVYRRTSTMLQRAQLKPELKQVIVTQFEFLLVNTELWTWIIDNSNTPAFADLSKEYHQITDTLVYAIETSSSQPVDKLCIIFDAQMKQIVDILQQFSSHHEASSKVNDLYRLTLATFSYLNMRVENVHYYEYYQNDMLTSQEYFESLQTVSTKIAATIQSAPKRDYYEVGVAVVKFVERLEEVAERFRIEANVSPKSFSDVLVSVGKLPVDELAAYLTAFIVSAPSEIANIIRDGGVVSARNALVRYLVALEELYVQVQNIIYYNHEEKPLYLIMNDVGIDVHNVMAVLEQISPEDKSAFDILHNQNRRVTEFVKEISKTLQSLRRYSVIFEYQFNELSESELFETRSYNNVQELKINIAMYVKHIYIRIGELCRAASNSDLGPDARTSLRTLVYRYQMVLHEVYVEVDKYVIGPQKVN